MRLFVPASSLKAAQRSVALVVALHGGLGSAEQFATTTRFDQLADKEGFIVAFPDGFQKTWNGGRCCGQAVARKIDDVGYIATLIATLSASLPIDPGRIYVTGHSNGAIMAFRFACERPELVTAIVPVAGSLEAPCPAKGPGVALLNIHGDSDRNLPLEGGVGDRSIAGVAFTSTANSMAAWNAAFGCPGTATTTASATLNTTLWEGCRDRITSQLTVIIGADHPWPGAQERRASGLQGEVSQALDATAEAWAFFKLHVRR